MSIPREEGNRKIPTDPNAYLKPRAIVLQFERLLSGSLGKPGWGGGGAVCAGSKDRILLDKKKKKKKKVTG